MCKDGPSQTAAGIPARDGQVESEVSADGPSRSAFWSEHLVQSALVSILFFVLPFADFLKFRHYAPIQFAESDTYYYLDVARFSQHTPFFSFDGTHPTNGFHPLWQWMEYVGVRTGFLPVFDHWKTLDHLFLGNLLILSVAVGLFALFALRRLRNFWLVFWISCPGLLWFLFSHGHAFFGWSDLNGMETAVEMLFASLTLLAFDYYDRHSDFGVLTTANMAASFFVLARLDDVFFLLPFSLLSLRRSAVSVPKRLLAACIPYASIALYLLYNRRTVGTYLPVSGKHKAGLVFVHQLHALVAWLLPVQGWKYSFAASPLNGEVYFHFLQMVVPPAVAAIYLLFRRSRGEPLTVLTCMSAGVIAKAAYNSSFVDLMLQGHWYYAPSITFANLLLVLALDRLISPDRASMVFGKHTPLYATAVAFCFAMVAFGFVIRLSPKPEDNPFYRIQESAPVLGEQVRSFGDKQFVEFDDGQISFALGTPSVSGFGLTGDMESTRALEKGSFFDLMEQRNVTLIASSFQYMHEKNRHPL